MATLNRKKQMSLPGIEPGTLSVLNSCDYHYTTKTLLQKCLNYNILLLILDTYL